MIYKLQNAAIVKPNITLSSIEKPTHQHYPAFTYALSLQRNTPISNKCRQPTI